MINTADGVTHSVEFWFIFLVYKFTAVYFTQGISTVIFALKTEHTYNKKNLNQ